MSSDGRSCIWTQALWVLTGAQVFGLRLYELWRALRYLDSDSMNFDGRSGIWTQTL